MKKLNKFLLMSMFVFLAIGFTPVFAMDVTMQAPYASIDKVEVEITSGLNLDKMFEVTFEKTLTLSGTCEKDATITIITFQRDEKGIKVETASYVYEVGATELFSQNINLDLGTNFITVVVDKENHASVVIEHKVKRISEEIKNKLQDTIVLPGGVTTTVIKP